MTRPRMPVWALTGPAGAGKSAVSRILSQKGAAIVDGDRLGHEILARAEIQAAIVQSFGSDCVNAGVVDRQALGAHVFADSQALQTLNSITHGPLGQLATEKLAQLAKNGEHMLAVFEAAVYFLLPSPPVVDLVVAVLAPTRTRVQRLMERGAGLMTRAEAYRRIAAQANLDQYWAQADEIIVNDGTLADLEANTLRLLPPLSPGRENSS